MASLVKMSIRFQPSIVSTRVQEYAEICVMCAGAVSRLALIGAGGFRYPVPNSLNIFSL